MVLRQEQDQKGTYPFLIDTSKPLYVHNLVYMMMLNRMFRMSVISSSYAQVQSTSSQKKLSNEERVRLGHKWFLGIPNLQLQSMFDSLHMAFCSAIVYQVRDRVRSKMERDILAEVNHPFIVKLHYGERPLLPS